MAGICSLVVSGIPMDRSLKAKARICVFFGWSKKSMPGRLRRQQEAGGDRSGDAALVGGLCQLCVGHGRAHAANAERQEQLWGAGRHYCGLPGHAVAHGPGGRVPKGQRLGRQRAVLQQVRAASALGWRFPPWRRLFAQWGASCHDTAPATPVRGTTAQQGARVYDVGPGIQHKIKWLQGTLLLMKIPLNWAGNQTLFSAHGPSAGTLATSRPDVEGHTRFVFSKVTIT